MYFWALRTTVIMWKQVCMSPYKSVQYACENTESALKTRDNGLIMSQAKDPKWIRRRPARDEVPDHHAVSPVSYHDQSKIPFYVVGRDRLLRSVSKWIWTNFGPSKAPRRIREYVVGGDNSHMVSIRKLSAFSFDAKV